MLIKVQLQEVEATVAGFIAGNEMARIMKSSEDPVL